MTLKPPKVPCGTCPYRRDVPAGIWHGEEYAKLPATIAKRRFNRQRFSCATSETVVCAADGC